jgi:hypothetical protein
MTATWIIVAAVLAVVTLSALAVLARTWRREVGDRTFELEVAM